MTDPDSLFDEMVDVAMCAVRDGFVALWERPNAPAILEDWLDRRAVFCVTRDAIEVRVLPREEA